MSPTQKSGIYPGGSRGRSFKLCEKSRLKDASISSVLEDRGLCAPLLAEETARHGNCQSRVPSKSWKSPSPSVSSTVSRREGSWPPSAIRAGRRLP